MALLSAVVFFSPIQGSVINTTGDSFNLNFGLTWEGGVVPWRTDTATIVHAGEYFLPTGAVLEFEGLNILAEGVAIVGPSEEATIHLGEGGISSDYPLGRIGFQSNDELILDVGESDQVWDFWASSGIGANVAGSAVISHTHGDNRLWLRGSNWAFNGTWRSDGGFIHPHSNAQWSGGPGATGQLVNGGVIRLSNELYDRIRLEMIGDGFFRVSGAATDNGSRAIMAPGSGDDTGDIYGPGTLTVDSMVAYGRLRLDGNVFHSGDTIVGEGAEGIFLELGESSSFTFYVAADGSSNTIRGQSAELSHLHADGSFVIDFVDEDYPGGEWLLIDQSSLTVEFGSDFSVEGFESDGSGQVWTRADGDEEWSFDLQTGVLSRTGEQIVDGLVLEPGVVTEDELLGSITGYTDSIGVSPMFNVIYVGLYPNYLYSNSLGWLLYPHGSASEGIYLFRAEVQNWIWLRSDIPGYFWDYSSESWQTL